MKDSIWLEDFFHFVGNERAYYHKWRKEKSLRWHKTQLKWYYKVRPVLLEGYQKPKDQKPDKYDSWKWRRDSL